MTASRSSNILACCALLASAAVSSNAFVVTPSPSSSTLLATAPAPASTSSALHLCRGQDSQLVAAFNAASKEVDSTSFTSAADVDDVSDRDSEELQERRAARVAAADAATTTSSSNKARAFVSRVFHLPSSLIHRHPHPKQEGFSSAFSARPELHDESKDDDVVLCPIVGFTYVSDGPNHSTALPGTSQPACRLSDISRKQEDVFGWYSAGCKLDATIDDYSVTAHQEDNLN